MLNVSVTVVTPSSIVIIYAPSHKFVKSSLLDIKPLGPVQVYVYVESPPFAVIFIVPSQESKQERSYIFLFATWSGYV